MSDIESRDAAIRARNAGENPIDYFRRRGYVYDITDEDGLREALTSGPVTGYIGFDPTAPSLHVGSQLGMMVLAVLQRFGHRPIALGGGGTAMVGDPSGKTSTRQALMIEEIQQNLTTILPQFGQFLDFEGDKFGANPPALLLNNADWLLRLGYIEFLRDIGRHFSVNEMLAAETYKLRVDSGAGLNFVEFNYRIAQAYDFLHLLREEQCTLQMGGSDQWGNIVAGVDLIRRADSVRAFGLVFPLLTTASGAKMGKSEGNSVWLDATMTSPFDYYQYWVNVDDRDVEKLLNLYTFLPEEEIHDLVSVGGDALRESKRVLARETTRLAHGAAAAAEAEQAAKALFASSDSAALLDDPTVPTTSISSADLAGMTIADLFVRAGLVGSKSEAKRLVQQGGLSVGASKVDDADQTFEAELPVLLRVGKKRFRRIEIA